MFVKNLLIRISREINQGKIHIATTILVALSMAIFVVILGMFINVHVKKFLVSEEVYFPQLNTLSQFYPWSPPHYIFCNSSSPSLLPVLPTNFSTGITGSTSRESPRDIWHSMSDEELMWHASMVPGIKEYPYKRTPKVAFMFLTRGELPLAPLWEKFFKGHEGLFSIYIHTSPEFTNEPPNSSVFYKRRIPSKPVQWGRVTMIDAERRLLANALLDFSNERFVLLSESCIPIFNFTTIYNYLINSKKSFVSSFDDPRPIGRGRYNKRMWPAITISDWRKGSQWFEVNRKLAIEMVSDVTYYPIFRDHCLPPCYMDEHYFATLMNKLCPELTTGRTITWVDWSRGGPHPTTFVRKDVSKAFLNRIRDSRCSYNGKSSTCFLFARKFHPSTLQPLMSIAPKLLGFSP